MTGEVSRGDLSDNDIAQRLRGVQMQGQRLNEETGVHRSLYATLTREGLNKKAVRAALKAVKQNDPEAVIRDLRDQIYYMQLMRVSVRPDDLFGGLPEVRTPNVGFDVWDAEDAGYRAGRDNVALSENPYTAGSELFVVWMAWHRKGAAAKARELGPDVAVAPQTRQRARQPRLPIEAAPSPPPAAPVAPVLTVVSGNGEAPRRPRGRPRKDGSMPGSPRRRVERPAAH